jgi:hypothetical protein
VRWNWLLDVPVGTGRPVLGGAGRLLNAFVGGWQVAGLGSLQSNYLTLPATMFPTGNKIETYGYKYPIEDCTSGTCYPGYLWYNGYIPAHRINSVDPVTGKPNGYMGIPADYKPGVQPLLPYPADYLSRTAGSDPNFNFYGTNTTYVQLKNGTNQRTTVTGLLPLRQQYLPSVLQWGLDASLFKTVMISENVRVRLNADFFNVLNVPGNPNTVGTTGMLATRNSGNSPRTLQLTLRLTW